MTPRQMLQARTPAGGGTMAPGRPASMGRRIRALLLTTGLLVVTLFVGWLAWSLVEWRRGRNPGLRLTGLHVVRRADARRAGFWRCALREVLCLVLVLPTMAACCILAVAFVMGASAPDGLLGQSRRAPWDVLSGTDVVSDAPCSPRRAAYALGELPLHDGGDPVLN